MMKLKAGRFLGELTKALRHSLLPACGLIVATSGAGAASGGPLSGNRNGTVTVHEASALSVAVSPDGKSLAIDLQGSLWLVPAKGGKATRITDYFNDARQPGWSPDGKRIAFFGYRDGTYHVWTVLPDGSGLKKLTDGIYDDRDPAWSPDGKSIAFASDRAGPGPASYNIWTVEVASGALRQITSDAFENRMPSWSPDGREIAYSSDRSPRRQIWARSLADGRERLLAAGDGPLSAPSWSPRQQQASVMLDKAGSRLLIDGRIVSASENVFPFAVSWLPGTSDFFYVSDGRIRRRSAGRVTTIPFTATLDVAKPDYPRAKRDFDTITPRRALGILKPTLSPDGSRIAFVALGDLYLVSANGGVPENLTKDHAADADPAWSPDGTRLAYSSDKAGGLPQLWIRDLKTGGARQLTSIATQPFGAAWSSDGKRIAFIDVDGLFGGAGVCVVDVATGKVTRLHASLPQPGNPSWSADGKFVAVALSKPFSKSFREGFNQIYLIPTDGKGKPVWRTPDSSLSMDTRAGGGPVWSPDGARMAAIYDGLLKVWPVASDGTPLQPPRSYTSEMSHNPSWAGNSRTILYQAGDRLKTIDIETGSTTEVPLDLTYVLDKPVGRTIVHVGALVDAVHDVTQRNKDIIIEGNRIVAIRDHDTAPPAPGVRFIDGAGLTAIPGLIEHHAHVQRDLGATEHRAWLAYGITSVRDPGSQHYDGIENREANEAGVRIGPRIYTAGPLFEWKRVYYKIGVAIASDAHLERELGLARVLQYDLLKSYVRMPDLQQRRITEAAHAMGVPVASHDIFPAAYSGVDATEHVSGTSRRGYSPKQGPQGRVYQDAVKLYGETRRTLTPTLLGAMTEYLAKHPSYGADPRMALYPQWGQGPTWGQLGGPSFTMPPGWKRSVKDAYDAGAIITAGTDTPIAINLHAEIASYVDAGLTPFQALQTATVNPARALNLDAGTLEAGKLADIVLVDGDPRQDIANTFNVRIVIANGRPHRVKDLVSAVAPPD